MALPAELKARIFSSTTFWAAAIGISLIRSGFLIYNELMDEKWKVLAYKTAQGCVPVNEFIKSLELKAQTKVFNALNLLRDYGLSVGLPHVKKVAGTELWELRILGADSIRIIYIAVAKKTFLLLHGFKKKKMKTPPKEIKTAVERLAEYRERLK